MNRRKLLKQSFWGLTGIGLLSGMYAWQIEPFWLDFVKVKMPIKNLPADLVGKTLMQISDIHVGKRFDHKFIIDSFEKARKFDPDFVVYTGDYVSTHKDEVQYKELDEVLATIVKGKMATLGILGNHDYGVNWAQSETADKISARLIDSGIQLLRNEQVAVNGLHLQVSMIFGDLILSLVKHLLNLMFLMLILPFATILMCVTWMFGVIIIVGYYRVTHMADK